MRPRPWRDHLPTGTDWDPAALTARGSLPAAWEAVWARSPNRPILYDGGAGHGARWVTAGEFEERTRRAAERLMGLGLQPGDRLLWSMRSSLDAVVAHVGALRTGVLVIVPANPGYVEREVAHIVDDVRPAAAVVDDSRCARWVREASRSPIPVLGPKLTLAGDVETRRPASTRSGTPVLGTAVGEAPAVIAYTSGTTGVPKGAVLTHANVLANSESIALTWRWTPEDRLVHALPVFHGHGLCVALYTTLLTGASAVLFPAFDAATVLNACVEHHASLFFGVPTMFHRLAASGRASELSRLRLTVSGSAPLPAGLHRELAERAGTVVLERYGMTETLMTLSNPYDGERRPGTVGFPFPGVEAWIGAEPPMPANSDAESDSDDGAEAEILVRGPTVFDGYWERPAATVERFVGAKWLRTGDIGSVDAEGYVTVRGRLTEMVISGGYNVYPAEVEDVLLTHPAVAEVAVTGTPSDEWGEVVTAWVVPQGPAPEAGALMAFAAERLASYKRPRLVRFVDHLPRNALGKIRRHQLG
ncbi:MAG TPA: AMP-binding protein [Acidimicrobiales bacterium]|nr:AMP-binding protein [Acidimicrobiales bacterium]